MKLEYSGRGENLGNYLRLGLKLSTRTRRRLKFRDGGITVNGEHATVRYMLKPGDVIELDCDDRAGTDTDDESFSDIIPVDLPLTVVYQDSNITVADKPGDMPMHPVHGHLDDTAANALAFLARQRGDSAFVFRPVNRLDRNTSGLFLAAENFISCDRLCRQMKAGRIEKTYLAILCGVPAEISGRIDAPIDRADVGTLMRVVREDGYPAVTDYKIAAISPDRKYSLAVVKPLTGRTHQIRVHMAHIGCPLLGDFMYGEESDLISRHALHACRLAFDHPEDGRRMVFTSAMPDDMVSVYKKLFLGTN